MKILLHHSTSTFFKFSSNRTLFSEVISYSFSLRFI